MDDFADPNADAVRSIYLDPDQPLPPVPDQHPPGQDSAADAGAASSSASPFPLSDSSSSTSSSTPPLLATGELDPSHLVQSQQSVFGNYVKMEWFFAHFDLHLLVGPCPSPWRMKHFLSLLSFTTFLLSMWIAPNRGSLHVVIANICWLRRSRRPWRWAPRGVTSYGTTVVRTLSILNIITSSWTCIQCAFPCAVPWNDAHASRCRLPCCA